MSRVELGHADGPSSQSAAASSPAADVAPACPADEAARLAALRRYGVLDTPPEPAFDGITRLIAQICQVPIAAIALIDGERQWFKSEIGLGVQQVPLDRSAGAGILLQRGLVVVPDLRRDERLAGAPPVAGPPDLRFYAGAALETPDGHALGALYVLDHRPRDLDEVQKEALRTLADQVMAQLELRRSLVAAEAEATAARSRSEARLRLALEAGRLGDWELDLATDTSVRSFRHDQIFGYGAPVPDGEWGYERFLRHVLPEDRAGVDQRFRRAVETRGPWRFECRIRRIDGAVRWIEAQGNPLSDAEGRPTKLLGVVADVTARKQAESALRDSEARYRALFEQAAIGVGYATLDGRWVAVNQAFADILGYTRDEMLGRRFQDLTHPDDLAEDLGLAAALEAGAIPSVERDKRYLRKDGSAVWAHITVSLLRDADGAPRHRLVMVQDITERKRAEAAVLESDERLRLAVEAANLGTWDRNLITGELTWSDRTRAIFGLPVGADADYDWFVSRVHPDDLPLVQQAMRRALDPDGDGALDLECRLVMPDGEGHWVAAKGAALFDGTGADRRAVRFIGIVQDITERRRAEAAVQESEERLQLALTASEIVGTWNWDVAGDRMVTDARFARLFSVDPARAAAGTRLEEFVDGIHPDDRPRIAAAVAHAVATGEEYAEEYRVLPADGSERWVYARGRCERDADGRPTRFPGALVDITERKRVEDALRRSEERFRLAQEAAGVGTYVWDVPGGTIRWSAEMYRLHGVDPATPAERLYDAWLERLHPEDRGRADREARASLERDGPLEIEFRVVRPDGQVRWIYGRGTVERDANGRPRRMIGVNIDVTERRRAEEALRDSEERFRSIFDHALTGIGLADPAGRIVRSNGALGRILDYAEGELVGRTILELTHPDDRERNMDLVRRLVAGELPSFVIEKRMIRRDGAERWVRNSASMVRDARGAPASLVAVVEDIHEQKRQRQELEAALQSAHESEARYRTLFEQAAVGVMHTAPDGRWLMVNEKLCAILGYAREELVGRTFQEFTHPEDLPADLAQVRELDAGAVQSVSREKRYFRKDGSTVWVHVTVSAVRDRAGALTQRVAVVQDITERKSVERELRRQRGTLKTITDNAASGLVLIDKRGHPTFINPAVERMTGFELNEIRDAPLHDAMHHTHPDGRPFPIEECPIDRAAETLRPIRNHEDVFVRKDGSFFPASCNVAPLERDGETVGAVLEFTDITERKSAEAALRLLIDELSHRVKNTLATVNAIADQMLKRGTGPDFGDAFRGRIRALAKTHALLSATDWAGADLHTLAEAETAPFGAERMALDGPRVLLPPHVAQTLGLVLHELATNAAKYGALSAAGGRLGLTWRVEGVGRGRELRLAWTEAGGPPVRRPARKGFGSTLIERGIEYDLNGAVEITFAPDGLRCAIEVPLAAS